jgi:thiol-disulfide isomerase/thioredoxin
MRHALLLFSLAACSTASSTQHGTASNLTTSAESLELCEHKVPGETCTRCHPELVDQFKKVNDWCAEHSVPESQCLICHPDLSFEPLPALPETADVKKISEAGEDVPALETHAAAGKVTIFDFYADWCAPCRKIDQHVFTKIKGGEEIALRKLNVVSWETPLAKRYLTKVPSLPYLVVYGRNGKLVREIAGFDLAALDAAIEEAGQR